MTSATRSAFGRLGLVALAVIFVVAVSLANVILRGARLDLTENKLYTLSAGHEEDARQHLRADQPLLLLLRQGDHRRSLPARLRRPGARHAARVCPGLQRQAQGDGSRPGAVLRRRGPRHPVRPAGHPPRQARRTRSTSASPARTASATTQIIPFLDPSQGALPRVRPGEARLLAGQPEAARWWAC